MGGRGLNAGVLDEPEPGAPADEKQREYAAGNNDERQLHSSASEQPQSHAAYDGAEPYRHPGFQGEWVPPGASDDRSDQAPSKKRPSRVRHAK